MFFFVAKECSTRLQLTYIVAGKPSNTHPRGYSDYTWLGGVIPHCYISPVPLISHPVPALTSVQKKVNCSLVEHGLQVTKHLKHPHLGNKGVMVWGCPLLGFYSRVRSRSYKGHFKGQSRQVIEQKHFLQYSCISGYW